MRLVREYKRSHATAGCLGVALGTVNSSRRDLRGGAIGRGALDAGMAC